MREKTEAAIMKEPGIIPFVDLVMPHEELQEDLLQVFRTALQYGRFNGGPMVEQFEADFGAFCGTTYCVGVATSSLRPRTLFWRPPRQLRRRVPGRSLWT